MKRMWVNQPSTLQPYHKLHGARVLGVHEYESTFRIYFTEGAVVSQQILACALSEGWPSVKSPSHPVDLSGDNEQNG